MGDAAFALGGANPALFLSLEPNIPAAAMSASGYEQAFWKLTGMSDFRPNVDIEFGATDVRF